MSRTERQYTLRLSATGHRQLEADLKALGLSGQKSLKLIQNATRPASAGLQATDRAARDLKGGLKAVSAEIPALQRLTRFLGPAALGAAIASFGRGALDAGRDFEAAMKRVEAVTGATEETLGRLADKARDVGGTTAFTAMEAADAIEVLAKSGLQAEAILGGALDATVALAGALGAELGPAADLVTDVMAQFRLEAGDLPDIADRLTGAALTSKFGFDDLRQAVGQAGGVAGAFGVTIDDLLTSLSATAASFASGSDAGTSFKTFLQRLTPQSKQAADVMEDLGLKFYDAQGNLKPMVEIAAELENGLSGLTKEAQNDALLKVFGQDAIRTALALAQTGADGFRDLASAIGEVSAEDQAAVRLKGLNGALRELAAAWEALQLKSAEQGGLDAADDAVRRLTEALRYLTENFETVNEVVERVAQALVVVLVGKGMSLAVARAAAFRAAYIEMAAAVTGVGTAAGRAVGPLTRLGVAGRVLTGVLGGPLGLAITALSLGALAIDLDKASDAMSEASGAADSAASSVDAYAEALKTAAQEQEALGGKVDATTMKMLQQAAAAARIEIDRATEELAAAQSDAGGKLSALSRRLAMPNLLRQKAALGELAPDPELNRFLARLSELAAGLETGATSFAEFRQEAAKFRQLPDDLGGIADAVAQMSDARFDDAGLDILRQQLMQYALVFGDVTDEVNAVEAAVTQVERAEAWRALARRMLDVREAAKVLSGEMDETLTGIVDDGAAAQTKVETLRDRFDDLWQKMEVIANGGNPFAPAEDGASDAADEVQRLADEAERFAATRIPAKDWGTYGTGGAGTVSGRDAEAYRRHYEARALSGMYPQEAELVREAARVAERLGIAATDLMTVISFETGGSLRTDIVNPDTGATGLIQFMPENLARYGISAQSSVAEQMAAVEAYLRDTGVTPGMGLVNLYAAVLAGDPTKIYASDEANGGTPGGAVTKVTTQMAGHQARAAGLLGAYSGASSRGVEDARAAEKVAEERRKAAEEEAQAIRDLVLAGEDQLAQLELERQLTGATTTEAARLTFIQQQLAAAKAAGVDVQTAETATGEKLIDVILRTADAIALQTAAREANRAAAEAEATSVEDSTQAVRNAFDNLKPGGDGLKAFFADLFQFVADKLWDLAFDPVWDTLGGLLSDLIGGIAGIGGGTAAPAHVSVAASGGMLPAFASGGDRWAGRAEGLIGGIGHGRQDNMLGLFSPGEFTQPKLAVDYYGRDFMEAIRHRRLPRSGGAFAAGGGLAMPSDGPSASPRGTVSQPRVALDIRTDPGVIVEIARAEAANVTQQAVATYDSQLPARMDQVTRDPRRRG